MTITDTTNLDRNLAALAARGTVVPRVVNAAPDATVRVTWDNVTLQLQTATGQRVRLYSAHDPAGEADRFVAPAFAAGEPALVIVVGLGLGYLLEAVERQSARTKVIALEPFPEAIRPFLARRSWETWLETGRLRLLVGPDYHGAANAWQDVDGNAPTVPIVHNPVLVREARADIVRAQEVAKRIVIGARSNAEARRRFGGHYLLNTLRNLPVIARSADVAALFGTCEGVPAIVVAAGPSLDRNLPALRDVQDRALVIAVDTALRPLMVGGVTPHVVVAVDSQVVNARHLVGVPHGGSLLVAEASVDPSVFPEFKSGVFTFRVAEHDPWSWLAEQGMSKGLLRAWGSVLTTTFDLALKMGCDPIVFVGSDLAYTGNQPYCRNTAYEQDWSADVAAGAALEDVWQRWMRQPEVTAVDIHGSRVRTTDDLIAFRDWLVDQSVAAAPRRIVNATGHGILSGGSIVQEALAPALVGGRPLVPSILRDAARPVAPTDARLVEAIRKLRGQVSNSTPSIPTWRSEASTSVDVGAITEALDAALSALTTV